MDGNIGDEAQRRELEDTELALKIHKQKVGSLKPSAEELGRLSETPRLCEDCGIEIPARRVELVNAVCCVTCQTLRELEDNLYS